MQRTLLGALMGAAMTLVSCGQPSMEGGFDSPVPAARMQAIERAARAGDRSPATLKRIVEQLDSDDPAVRLVAIGALERLTGETHGFRAYDPPIERRAAVRRWSEYVESESHG